MTGGGGGGVLATAGDLVFTGDAGGNFVAFDATNGIPLWHSRIGSISNAPQTYLLDGRQHVLAAVGDIALFVRDLLMPTTHGASAWASSAPGSSVRIMSTPSAGSGSSMWSRLPGPATIERGREGTPSRNAASVRPLRGAAGRSRRPRRAHRHAQLICTVAVTSAALARGKHVISDKPLATTAADAAALLDAGEPPASCMP